jgi:uncharacterized protein (DUF1697 family)
MPCDVAFLRGINLGRRRPPMTELKRLFEQLGFSDVATFIASGNVVFTTKERDARKLETQIEKHLAARLGYGVDTFVRSDAEVVAVLQARPFKEMAPAGGAVHVAFLKDALSPAQAKLLEACGTKVDAFAVEGREFYWQCLIRTSESEVWKSAAMKAIKLPTMTLRNLTSVRKLAAKHGWAVGS